MADLGPVPRMLTDWIISRWRRPTLELHALTITFSLVRKIADWPYLGFHAWYLAHLCNEVKGINYRHNIRRLEVMVAKLKEEMVAYEAECEHFTKRLADEAAHVESLDLCLRV
ncbi:uncharacterized protein LOC126598695 [Malus sylvestris]|uniref:uncharacterized protein LOC126598695 n=1 Tax=Malus sylvestris TaxID=3752 RepID=UPI0021AC3646|nr:uncharacterized protein LOC126598695 [Malus sylvestris]